MERNDKLIALFLSLSLMLGLLISPACYGQKNTEKRDPNAYYASTKKVGNSDMIVCNVDKVKAKVKIPLSKLVDNCEMICLETKTASLLSELRRFAVSDNYLCVAGFGGNVKLFKRDGRYVCDIGRVGKGPGEYISTPYQIVLNEKANSIFLTPVNNVDKILCYDLKGSFVKAIPLLYKSPKAKIWIDGDIVTVASMVFDDKTPVVYQQTLEGKLVQKLPVNKGLLSRDYNEEIFSSGSNNYDFQIMSKDTLFHYNAKQNRLEPQLLFPPFANSGGQILRELSGCYFGHSYVKVAENKYDALDVIIDKKTLEASFYEVVNDYYGGLLIKNLSASSSDTFIMPVSAINLIGEIKRMLKEDNPDAQARQKLQNILSKITENDNDILFVGKFKKAIG